jgi:hypothetical protein
MNSFDRIEGAEKLVGVFGYWPSFHDAEVLWMRLDRRPICDDCYGPILETLIRAFEMTNEVGPDGFYVLRHHVLVHFRFHDVKGVRLKDFNNQNMLHGLSIADIREHQMERIHFEVGFDSTFGVNASLQCYRVEVVSVTPCTKDATPLWA